MLRRIIGLLFCAWTVVTPPASGETLYGADGAQGNPSNLYTLDPTSGAVLSTVGAIGFAVTGLAIHPGTRVMYGATANADGVISPRSLITINKSTGSGSLLGPFLLPDGPQTLTDLTFTSDGTLYGLGSHDGQLYTVNLATGAATVVGESGVGSPAGGGLAADPCDTIHVAPNSDEGLLFTLDRTTGLASPGAQLNGSSGNTISAMAYNSAGTLYAALLDNSQSPATASLVTIDTLTGDIAVLGPTVSRLDAIVFDGQFASPNLSLTLSLNRQAVGPGGVVQASLTAANPGGAGAVDLYFVILVPPATSSQLGCPGGDGVVFLADAFSTVLVECVSTAPVQSFEPLFRNVCLPAGLPPTTVPSFFSLTWPPNVPAGTYTFAMFATPSMAFAHGIIDIKAFTSAGLEASP